MTGQYVATFHTHLSALRSFKALQAAGVAQAKLAPVPRALSSSCGTCVLYEHSGPALACMDQDLEAVYRRDGSGYSLIHRGEE